MMISFRPITARGTAAIRAHPAANTAPPRNMATSSQKAGQATGVEGHERGADRAQGHLALRADVPEVHAQRHGHGQADRISGVARTSVCCRPGPVPNDASHMAW